jgi:hypothetical protein
MELAFLSAALLGGLLVAVIPPLIHLISKRRARRVRFAPIALLFLSHKRTARSIRLRQLLLLLLRTLLFCCVALAIAQPLLKANAGARATQAPLVVVVAIDTSASMHALVDGRTLFQSARARALDELKNQPADVRVGAVACDDPPRDLAPPTFERTIAVDAVAPLEPRFHKGDLLTCVARATALARAVEGDGERRVIVLSDLAAHGFPFSAAATGVDGHGVIVEWHRPVDDAPPPNHAITALHVARTAGRSGDALEVSFGAAQFGGGRGGGREGGRGGDRALPSDVTADLFVGTRRAARLSMTLTGGQAAERTFHYALTSEGTGAAPEQLSVILSDDALALDNEMHLPFEIPAPLPVLIVDGAPQPVPFRDEVFYLESALRDSRGGQRRLAVEVIGGDQLKPGALAGQRVVILANVARVDDASAAALVEHVRAGGGLLMTMGDQVDVEAWNRTLSAVLPAPLRGAKGQALLDDASVAEVLSFARFRTDHPVLRGMAEGAVEPADAPGLGRVRTHTLMLLEPSADSEREVLMRFSNDTPALLERSVDAGRAMLLATTIDRDWSDLAIRPGFLPLVRQIVLHLAGALDDGGPRVLRIGEARRIRVARGTKEVEVVLPARATPGDGAGSTAGSARIPVEAGAHEVLFKNTTVPGLYRVRTTTASGTPIERREERFTVLVDPAESDLSLASDELLAQATPTGAVTRTLEAGDDDVPLWPCLLLLAAALIVAESLVLLRAGTRDRVPRVP